MSKTKASIPEQYALDVISGDVVASKWVRLACERHFRDLEEADERGIYFDHNEGMMHIKFFSTYLKHTVGKYNGKPFVPLPWQQFILWQIFGWKLKSGVRRFNYSYIQVARKNGKSTLGAGLALDFLDFDLEHAAECYFAATKRDQARIPFEEAKRMVKKDDHLRQRIKPYISYLAAKETDGKAVVLSSDKDSMDGLNIHFALVDEYHAHKDDKLFNVLKSAMGSRTQPMHFTITTAGLDKRVPCYSLMQNCKDVLEGVKQDDALFCMIYGLDDEDDWNDESNWIKANPSLGASISIDYLRKQYTQAVNQGGSLEVEFKTKHLNMWVDAAKTWIQDTTWMGAAPVSPNLTGRVCYAGLDLASVSDITALVLVFPNDDGSYDTERFYWLPEETANRKLNSDPSHIYRQFLDNGDMFFTPGNVTDYAAVRRFISGYHVVDGSVKYDDDCLMTRYDVKSIAYDPYNSTQLVIDLSDDGVKLAPFRQGFLSMSSPTKEMERLVMQGLIHHDGDPVLRWMMSNVSLRTDPAGNIKPDKEKSGDKIDGVVALIMALGECMTYQRDGKDFPDEFKIITL